jgi:CBS domain-containing protein
MRPPRYLARPAAPSGTRLRLPARCDLILRSRRGRELALAQSAFRPAAQDVRMCQRCAAMGSSMKAEKLNAGDICTRVVVVAERSTTVLEAAQRMREQHVGCLVVVEPRPGEGVARAVVGVVTDRDIVTGVVAKGLDPQILCVEDVMSGEVVTARSADSFAQLLAAMQRKGVRRLPVTDGEGSLVGLVTLDDLVEILAEQMHGVAQAIEAGQRHERLVRR